MWAIPYKTIKRPVKKNEKKQQKLSDNIVIFAMCGVKFFVTETMTISMLSIYYDSTICNSLVCSSHNTYHDQIFD